MARGTRAPSQYAYRGSIGKTQTSTMHVTGSRGEMVAAHVHTTVDAVSDPELVERLYADAPPKALNVVTTESGEQIRVAVPVVYHDPAAEVMVLVLADAHRHREIEERIRLLERMRADDAPIPPYAKEFGVVYGPAGLRTYLERRANDALERSRVSEADRELATRELALDRRGRDLEQRSAELERRAAELERRATELDRRAHELERHSSEVIAAEAEVELSRAELRRRSQPALEAEDVITSGDGIPRAPDGETKPVPKQLDEIEASLQALVEMQTPDPDAHEHHTAIDLDEQTTGSSIIPPGCDPLTTETFELTTASPAPAAGAREASSIALDRDEGVRLTLVAGEQLARGLGGKLDVRVLLHRTPHYPLVTLVIGPPAALRLTSTTQIAVVPLDIAAERHRQVLATLARSFELVVDVMVRGRRMRQLKLVAPLADNVGYILRAADDHLRGLVSSGDEGRAQSFELARDLVLGAGYDLLGAEHPDASEFRDDKLAQLETAQHLRRAIAMARRFARPSREDYLVCTRGFPLSRWRDLLRHVLDSAVSWGLWMGADLAQVAVSEGLARSRRDLVVRLDRAFAALKAHPTAYDIDDEAAEDNVKALAEEAASLGMELPSQATNHDRAAASTTSGAEPRSVNGAFDSEHAAAVHGSIGVTPPAGTPQHKTVDELLADLEDRTRRVAAAVELCDRGDARAAGPVIASVEKLSRSEAVRVLGMCVKFGDAAVRPLMEGLRSSKSFLRHGSALALALLRTDDGTQAVIDLLLAEPTEIWREVARALGQTGTGGLMPLASNYGRLDPEDAARLAERVAWAMAHIAVRGGRQAVEVMANGHSVIAPVARKALELHATAANDHVRVRPGADGSQAGRDVTVNRAFSRRFFEALEQGLPDAAQAGLEDLDESRPMELLDESDLIDDDEAELDESDLIQT